MDNAVRMLFNKASKSEYLTEEAKQKRPLEQKKRAKKA
jgi:hypothetical protein